MNSPHPQPLSRRQSALEDREIAFVRVTDTEVMSRLPDVLNRIVTAISHCGSYSTASTPPLPQRRERGPGGEG